MEDETTQKRFQLPFYWPLQIWLFSVEIVLDIYLYGHFINDIFAINWYHLSVENKFRYPEICNELNNTLKWICTRYQRHSGGDQVTKMTWFHHIDGEKYKIKLLYTLYNYTAY